MVQEKTTRRFTCVSCPVGCDLVVTLEDGKVTEVTGNTCPRGIEYAENEATNPKRILTMLIDVAGSEMPLSCKSTVAVPKGQIPECIAVLREVKLELPVKMGQVIVEDICGTGADIVATKEFSA